MNRRTRKTLVSRRTLVGAALAAGLVLGGPHSGVRAAGPVVGVARNVTVNFVNADIVDVLKALATQTGRNIVAGPEVKGPVSISLRDVDLATALDMVTRLNSLAYEDVDGTYVVASPARLKEMYPRAQVNVTYALTAMTPETAVNTLKTLVPAVRAQAQGTTMVILSGDNEDVTRAKGLLAQMEGADTGTQGERITEVVELRYLNVLEAMRVLASVTPDVMVTVAPGYRLPGTGKVGSAAGGTSEISGGTGGANMTQKGATAPGATLDETQVTLAPGEEPTALLLTGYASAIERAKDLLRKVDVAPQQVEITARVVDLSNTDAINLGLQYAFGNLDLAEADGTGDPTGTVPRDKPYKFGQFFRVPFDVGIKLDALATQGDTKILANPSIAALSGRPARIFIGDTVTAVISRDVTTTGSSVVTEKIHAGITLLVTPRVGDDGTVLLEVHPTVSALTGLDVVDGITLPQVSERSVDTTIHVKDGETVALGGLIREDEIKSMSKVPLLGDIPLFGELFRHRNNRKVRSDVTIFITTKVVKPTV